MTNRSLVRKAEKYAGFPLKGASWIRYWMQILKVRLLKNDSPSAFLMLENAKVSQKQQLRPRHKNDPALNPTL